MEPTSVTVNNEFYDLHGKVASGEFCDVYYGSRVDPLTVVAFKLARENSEVSVLALRQECANIDSLARSDAQGSDYFRKFLPQTLVRSSPDNVKGPGGYIGVANVFLWPTGFQYTYEDIGRVYPQGVDGRTAVWLWKRTLDMLGWVHESGYVHGSVTPQHILVHPRDHGSILVGWSRAVKSGTPLRATSTEYKMYYPEGVWDGAVVTQETDITMSARSMFCVLGGDLSTGTLPKEIDPRFADLVYAHAEGGRNSKRCTTAWGLLNAVDTAAKVIYGSNRFHPFDMPSA